MYDFFYNKLDIDNGDGRCDLIESELKNKNVLDLGCFEGGHTYQFEKKGANVIGIEANIFSYLKCLLNKNTLNMKSKFLLGCANKYMEQCILNNTRYDLIFCCGLLYHMTEPIKMLNSMSKISNSFYIWTLIVTNESEELWDNKNILEINIDGFKCKGYKYYYPDRYDRDYAGSHKYCVRLKSNTIIDACKHFGFSTKILECPNGNFNNDVINLYCSKI